MDNLLQQGVTAYKAGKRDEARKIFITVVKQSPDSEPAWGWMYQASNNDKERIHCLKQILRINPNSEKAKQMLDSLTGQDFPFEEPQKDVPLEKSRKDVPPEQPSVPPQRKAPREKKKGSSVLVTLILVVICCLVAFIAIPSNPTILSIITNVFNSGGIDIGGVIKPPLANAIIGTWCNIVTPSYEIPTCFTFSKGGLLEYSGVDRGGFPDHYQGNYAVIDNTSIRVDDPRPLGGGSFVCTDAQVNGDQLMLCETIYYNIALVKISQTQTGVANAQETAVQSARVTPDTTAIEAEKAQMILIPAGEFTMGSNEGLEKPIHSVYLDSFRIDPYEVTNAAYKRCVDVGACIPPDVEYDIEHYGKPEYSDYPVVEVNWIMAKTYCEWRDARLPTEAEWEKAARGTDGRMYPWGNEAPNVDLVNWGKYYTQDSSASLKVGSYPKGISPYGVYDMAGNVWEWTNDYFNGTDYQNLPLPNANLEFGADFYRIIRGGGAHEHASLDYRSAYRFYANPDQTFNFIGFRCARNANP